MTGRSICKEVAVSVEEMVEFCIAQGNKLAGAQVYYREDWDCYYFDIAGKYFGLLSAKSDGESFITLKNLPEVNEELRANYQAIRPGYYTKKVHWNSIDLTSDEISEELLTSLIKSSYQLVVSKLPKKVQAALLEK